MKNIPNILSVIRILLIPLFAWQMLKGNSTNAAIILVISACSDVLDGFLARRFNWVTPLGKVLDPTADKMTQVTVCIVLAIKLRTYWPFFAILLLKDALMLTLGGYLIKKGAKLEGAKWFGKVTTSFFYVTMTLIVFFPDLPSWVTITMLSITTVCAITSGCLYIPDYIRYKNEVKNSG